ncbi:MAG: colanic acid biosynthesis glycosyltransferase WcaL [Acidobacteria bacterium]|nr:MAG: colanic acid biosynthesis glycosyltransferase WcaL [Acidobacteriota bacterium]
MRIGYVLKCFPRLSETFILTEVLELERLGWDLTVFTRRAVDEPVSHGAIHSLRAKVIDLEPLLRERLWEPFEVHRRLAGRLGRAHEAALQAALELHSRDEMRAWLLAGVVAERALTERFDLIHAHFATGSASIARYAARLTGTPFTFTAHARDIYWNEVDPRRLRLLEEEAEAVVTISEANRAFLQSMAPAARVKRVYNGVDLGRFPALPRPPAPQPPCLLFVGRMVEKKGLADLLAACSLLGRRGVSVQCRLVGSGPQEPLLRQQARALGLDGRVEFRGPANQEEVASVHLPEASVFVLPSVVAPDGDRDGLPTSLLEAMARGVPVVSTRLSGIPEAVPDGEAGLLVTPGDVAALADAIALTLHDPEATLRRTLEARRHVTRLFDARRNVSELSEIFRMAASSDTKVEARR